MNDRNNEFLKENFEECVATLEKMGMIDTLIGKMQSGDTIKPDEPTMSDKSKFKVMTLSERRKLKDAMADVTEGRFYAIAAFNGFGLYRDYDRCRSQVVATVPGKLPYLREAYVKSFETTDEAIEWIRWAMKEYFGITGLAYLNTEYLLKWECYWFSQGPKMPWEKKQVKQSFSNYSEF